MNALKDYVNWKLTHADKVAEAEGYPLTMENCKANKRMKQLEIYGNSFQDGTPTPENPIEVQSVGELVTDEADGNFGKYKIPVVQRGINLFDISKHNATTQTINGITFTPLGDERIHIKGKLEDTTKAANYRTSHKIKIPIKPGTYKAKPCKYSKKGVTVQFNISNGSNASNVSANNTSGNVTFDNAYINFAQIYISGITVEFDDVIEWQLTKGTEDLPYEPYVEPVTTNVFLNEPLRKVGDYADYIDFKNCKVFRRIMHEQITGIAGKSSNGLVFLSYINHKPLLTGTPSNPCGYAVSDKFKRHLDVYSMLLKVDSPMIQTYISTSGGFRTAFAFGDKTITDVAMAQEAIGDGFELYYALAIPTEELITCELPKLKSKTTIIEADTSLAPSNAKGKYIKR